MKKIFIKAALLLVCAAGLVFSSCNDFLDVLPKGKKIPKTLADYEALLRDEYSVHMTSLNNQSGLLNDYFTASSSDRLYLGLVDWDETMNRIELGNGNNDTGPYNYLYGAIAVCNLILEDAPGSTEATDAEKAEVMAYARVLRAMKYYDAVNVYAAQYDKATAADTRGVPFITSAAVGAPYPQTSVAALYEFITGEVEAVLADGSLPKASMTVLHPNKGAAYAFLARVYLTMGEYDKALSNANLALAENDKLYDWVAYYNANAESIADWNDTKTIASPMGFTYVENYNLCHWSRNSGRGQSMYPTRGERFEENDLKFRSSYYLYGLGDVKYYRSRQTGYYNYSGMKTVEVYLIKAECLARGGQYAQAMAELNKVRKTRVYPYTDLSALTEQEAMNYIRQWKENELIFSIVPYSDTRRLNKETAYRKTFTKQVDGSTVSLTPDSHLWIFPFPSSAIGNTSGGKIEHNVDK